ncbi:ABC transporter permease [Patescibacteria group bacterium]|nr:ABC transporter permease [Patescibacteria group bacterium]MBU4368078.1 ABC transporter permease [Patescibacteria group bacterium]MBU4462307.1 ABC transporter permease [Patescibacteria group bacterium]
MFMLKEYFKVAIKSLRARRLRSWLTILGVVIGVFLIVSLMSLSEGIKTAIMQQLKMMGKDLIMIFPGEITDMATMMGGGLELTENDMGAIKKAEGVETIVPLNYKAEAIRHEGRVKTILINGVSWKDGMDILKNDFGWSLKEGDWPAIGKKEIIVGSAVPTDVFPGMMVGDEAVINGRKFIVSGILKSLGNKQDDSTVTVDLDIFKDITGEKRGAKFVLARVKNGYEVDEVVENIKRNLLETRKRVRGLDSPSFSVLSSEKVMDIVGSILGMIQIAIFGFASIAIVVGGVGIMNTMYTSVRERTKEIGIMKAIGAKNSAINTIFLIESGFFGLFGGLGGMVLGLGLAKAVEFAVKTTGGLYLQASITPQLIIFSLGFSFLVGCISGFLPARQASKLKPVDALRYE